MNTALMLGFAAATVATIIRAFVPTLWLLVKPFSCDLCMSWWSSLVLSVAVTVQHPMALTDAGLMILAATAVSMLLLKTYSRLSDIGSPPPTE